MWAGNCLLFFVTVISFFAAILWDRCETDSMSKKITILTKTEYSQEELLKDRKGCRKYDQCGLGEKAVYMGSYMHPRMYCIPYASITHIFRRVAVSESKGKGLTAPILYLVVRYDGGKEQECSFRYLQDADKMMDDLARTHPEISRLSPEGEEKKKEKEVEEEKLEEADLPVSIQKSITLMEKTRWEIHKRPGVYENLAGTAYRKRRMDLIAPWKQKLALCLFLAGVIVTVIGFYVMAQGQGMQGIMIALVGIMLMVMMVSTRILPSRKNSREKCTQEYLKAVEASKKAFRHLSDFPLPYWYAHPYVCDRMIRILMEERAGTPEEALSVLKEDLKRMDSSVALGGEDYTQVTVIKPLFTVRNYE